MNFLKRIFSNGNREEQSDIQAFWNWFLKKESAFYKVVQSREKIDEQFIQEIMPRLQSLNSQFYCLTGMRDEDTAELIITAEGDIKTFVFVEELVAVAPAIKGWMFTALKPYFPSDSRSILMDGIEFDNSNISFIYNEKHDYPDLIDLTLVHHDYNEDNKETFINGTFIFLDNALGELNAATLIDTIEVVGRDRPEFNNKELISIEKLNDFLAWKEKEFVEKYEGIRRNTDKHNYSGIEGEDEQGLPSIAVINEELLEWDAKASHPWMMVFEFKYKETNRGMPDSKTLRLMEKFEDELMSLLIDSNGYLNLGRQTYNGTREVYMACKEFRYASKVAASVIAQFKGRLNVTYDIYKDKYWMTMNQFMSL